VNNLFEEQSLRNEAAQLRARVKQQFAIENMVGSSSAIQHVYEVIRQAAPSRATVLITGESGTGKELVANALHQNSPRANGPFIKVHCAALAESLLESELFGHEKGSFTGAAARRDGRFSLADGGTLFLDEIGEIPPSTQIKLLRVLQEQEFERVGGTQTQRVDVRVIAATNRNLHDEIATGRFREDLYFRLHVVAIEMPALRERRGDVLQLANLFLERFARANGKQVDGFAPETAIRIAEYDWPGNVRELENAIERAVVLTKGTHVPVAALPTTVKPSRTVLDMPEVPGATLAELERYAILETMRMCDGSTSRAAAILGLSLRTVQYRVNQYRDAEALASPERVPHPT
jgi:DNA-binding NtrC family response regulator